MTVRSSVLLLDRYDRQASHTFGFLSLFDARDGSLTPLVHSLEGLPLIPLGVYPLAFEWSRKFQRDLWEVKDVPGMRECKFHAANLAIQLDGCIAVGFARDTFQGTPYMGDPCVTHSQVALQHVHRMLRPFTSQGLTLAVRNVRWPDYSPDYSPDR